MTLNICSSYFYVPSAAIMGLGHHCHLKNILNITSTGSTSGKINRFTNSTSTVLFCTRFIWQRNAEPGMDNMGQFLSTPSNREPFFSRWIIWSPKKCICSLSSKIQIPICTSTTVWFWKRCLRTLSFSFLLHIMGQYHYIFLFLLLLADATFLHSNTTFFFPDSLW